MRSMQARVGRDKQRYNSDGARMVAGAVVLNADKTQVLLVSSEARPECWVLPKGGAEKDETLEESALRETWEESGAVGTLGKLVGSYVDDRPPKHWKKDQGPPPPRTEFHIYEMAVERLEEQWPEGHKRRRKWMSYDEAHKALLAHNRIQLAHALEDCSCKR